MSVAFRSMREQAYAFFNITQARVKTGFTIIEKFGRKKVDEKKRVRYAQLSPSTLFLKNWAYQK